MAQLSTKLEILFGLRFLLDRYGYDPCDEVDIDLVLNLPEGLSYRAGQVQYECESCGEWTELPIDPSEYEHGHPHNVCGRSSGCCP